MDPDRYLVRLDHNVDHEGDTNPWKELAQKVQDRAQLGSEPALTLVGY